MSGSWTDRGTPAALEVRCWGCARELDGHDPAVRWYHDAATGARVAACTACAADPRRRPPSVWYREVRP